MTPSLSAQSFLKSILFTQYQKTNVAAICGRDVNPRCVNDG